MKCLTLIVHQSAKQHLLDLLSSTPEVPGFTLVQAEGHTDHTGDNPFESIRDRVLGYVPRIRVDVLLEDDAVDPVLARLRDCESCMKGRGIWWVTSVATHGTL
ncbi:MAG: DUF3240 family protein [Deltaproteobacteria bacterium]|nr:DUF3240 family protein [Deltaproteobacteria bacterium]